MVKDTIGTVERYRHVQPEVRVRLIYKSPFWGPGTEQIMRGIMKTESVREACREMDISYSKALGMIHNAEKELGIAVVERQQGGKNGGVSRLTGEGEQLMRLFEELQKEVQDFAEKKYHELAQNFFGQGIVFEKHSKED